MFSNPRKFAAYLILMFAMFIIGRHIAPNAPSDTATCDQTNTTTISPKDVLGVPVEVDEHVGGALGGDELPKMAVGQPEVKSIQQTKRQACINTYTHTKPEDN